MPRKTMSAAEHYEEAVNYAQEAAHELGVAVNQDLRGELHEGHTRYALAAATLAQVHATLYSAKKFRANKVGE